MDSQEFRCQFDADLINRIAYAIIHQGIASGADEICLRPQNGGLGICYRVNGEDREVFPLPDYVEVPLMAQFKAIVALDVSCYDRVQRGVASIHLDGRHYRLYARIAPEDGHESAVMEIKPN